MTAQEILAMIEAVDPADTAKLDEIDRWVCRYVHGMSEGFNGTYEPEKHRYTSSRDALKAIRPKGYSVYIQKTTSCMCTMEYVTYGALDEDKIKPQKLVTARNLPTEELAELHAIIQAIAYERQQK